MQSTRQDHWAKVYATKGETEVSWFQPVPQVSLDLVAHAGTPRNAAIIDIGAGASRLVDALLAAGYGDLTVLDIAAAALEKAKARLKPVDAARVAWIAADITAWTPPRDYALWHDRAVFHFLTDPADRAAYRRALQAGTRPGSQIIIGTFAPDGPSICSGLPVQRYSAENLAAELGPDYALLEQGRDDHRTPGGNTQHFQFCRFARR